MAPGRKYPVCQTHLKKLKVADLSQESKDSEMAAMTEYISSNRPWGQGSYPSNGYVSPVSGCTLHFGNVSTLHPDSAALDGRLREMAEVLGVQDYASTVWSHQPQGVCRRDPEQHGGTSQRTPICVSLLSTSRRWWP
ncbi:surface protein [Frog virus 3]|uniref:Surface protein n=1 Tax=Frog virus 3 TaxID=10493 RepID=A0A5B8P3M0_FRG3V|nr:surface protein [Frog virus 3]